MATGFNQGDLQEDAVGEKLVRDAQGAAPLNPGEQADLDQIESGLNNGDTAKEPDQSSPAGGGGTKPSGKSGGLGGLSQAGKMAGQFAGRNKKKFIIGGGAAVGIIVPVIALVLFLSVFKLKDVEKLYIDYQFTKVHRALSQRARRLAKEAKNRAKGAADTPVDKSAPLGDQVDSLNSDEVNKAATDPTAADQMAEHVQSADASIAGTGAQVDANLDINRKVDPIDEKGKSSADLEKEAKLADRAVVQNNIPAPDGTLSDVGTQEEALVKEGASPEAAAAANVDKVPSFGAAADLSTAAALSTFYCIGRDIYGQTLGKWQAVGVQEQARLAARTFAIADGSTVGAFSLSRLGAEGALFDSATESYTQSASYRRATHQPVTSQYADINPMTLPFSVPSGALAVVFSAISLNSSVVDKSCEVILNPTSQWAIVSVDVVLQAFAAFGTGGVSEGVEISAMKLLKESAKVFFSKETAKGVAKVYTFQKALQYLGASAAAVHAGAATTGTEDPIQRANKVDAGTDILQAETSRLNGGRRLSDQESAMIELNQRQDEVGKQSIAARVFNIRNPTSTGAIFLASFPTNFGGLTRGISSMMASVFTTSGWVKLLGSLQPTVVAATIGDPYGVPQYGFTDAELNRFGILDNAKYVEAHPELATKYGDCFTGTLVDAYNKNDPICNDRSDDMLHYRLYLLDKSVVHDFATTYNSSSGSTSAAPISGSYSLPVDHYHLGPGFGVSGPRWGAAGHTGMDFDVPTGTPLRAVADGILQADTHDNPPGSLYGIQTELVLPNGAAFLYAHQSKRMANFAAGMAVKAGEIIGYSGATGNVTGPHLHFEYGPTGGFYTRAADPLTWFKSVGLKVPASQ